MDHGFRGNGKIQIHSISPLVTKCLGQTVQRTFMETRHLRRSQKKPKRNSLPSQGKEQESCHYFRFISTPNRIQKKEERWGGHLNPPFINLHQQLFHQIQTYGWLRLNPLDHTTALIVRLLLQENARLPLDQLKGRTLQYMTLFKKLWSCSLRTSPSTIARLVTA